MLELLAYFVTLLVFVILFTFEVIAPASGNDCDRRWQIYASSISALQLGVALFAGWVFRELFLQNSLFHLPSEVPLLIGALCSFIVTSFFAYWWHRLTHASPLLWRVFHQLHHSPRRVEALTAFYVHPFDGFAANILNVFVAFMILGLPVEGAAIAITLAAVYNLYIHSDTRSPYWLGYLVQRPEMHRVHHQSGVHAMNYGLPLWDLLFGTFRNPTIGPSDVGFTERKEAQIKDMLLLKDIDG